MKPTATLLEENQSLQNSLNYYQAIFNAMPDAMLISNAQGMITMANQQAERLLGYTVAELETMSIEHLIPERSRNIHAAHRTKFSSTSGSRMMGEGENVRVLCKNGSELDVEISLSPIKTPQGLFFASALRDVTATKKAQEKLQLADMVYENSIEGILITDVNNCIISANPAFTEITGYSLAEVLGKNPRIFKSGQHDAHFYKEMWRQLHSQGFWQGEVWDRRKNGELHAKFLNIKVIQDSNGQIYRYLAIFSDITARKQYEEEIKRLSESELNKAKLEAEKASRAKSDFLSSMSHELRTPMNAVLGFAQLLELEDLNVEQRESVQHILTAGRHLLDLINQVLDLSKIEADKLDISLETTALSPIVQSCLNLTKPLQNKYQVEIINNAIDCQHHLVMADEVHLRQVLLNLVSNAIKYNRPHGTVQIFCEQTEAQTLRINVVDTGQGLSEVQLAKLFQPFERLNAKNSHIEGSGVGLVITKKLVEAMHGKIGVSSTVGTGSCFWIEIPKVSEI